MMSAFRAIDLEFNVLAKKWSKQRGESFVVAVAREMTATKLLDEIVDLYEYPQGSVLLEDEGPSTKDALDLITSGFKEGWEND